MKKFQRRNLKQLSKLTIGLVFLLMLTIANANTIVDTKKDQPKPKWPSIGIHGFVSECYQQLNMSSIQNFGVPVIPFLGLNQCSCILDKIRLRFEHATEYMKEVRAGKSGEIISGHAVECVIEGAMGEELKKAYLKTIENNNKQKLEKPLPIEEDTSTNKKDSTTNPVTWDELIKKNGK
jgi:hypothetical protein